MVEGTRVTSARQCILGTIQDGRRKLVKQCFSSHISRVRTKELLCQLRIRPKKIIWMNFEWRGWRCQWQTIFRFHYFKHTVTTRYQKRSLPWNPMACSPSSKVWARAQSCDILALQTQHKNVGNTTKTCMIASFTLDWLCAVTQCADLLCLFNKNV